MNIVEKKDSQEKDKDLDTSYFTFCEENSDNEIVDQKELNVLKDVNKNQCIN